MEILSCLVLILVAMVIGPPSQRELQRFHKKDILLFNRIVGKMRKNSLVTKKVFSLWFCLEELGYYLLDNLILCDDMMVEFIFNETVSLLDCIGPNAMEPGEWQDELVMSTLMEVPIKQRFVYFNRDVIFTRTCHFFNEVSNKIFGENIAIEVDNWVRPRCQVVEASKMANSRAHIGSTSQTGCGVTSPYSLLHPFSRPYSTSKILPADQRTMFLTFSHGYPISKEDILEFFTTLCGDVVEDLIIDKKHTKSEPEYARIIFKDVFVISIILNGKDKVKFNIKGKQLWARIFVPRRHLT